MTTKYYIGTVEIVTLNSIGISVERYSESDYWKVRLYAQDAFSNNVINSLITNKASCGIGIEDGTGTVTFTGVVVGWESTTDYSYANVINCTCTKV